MDKQTLKPCPFCGVTPSIVYEQWTEISKTSGAFRLSTKHQRECFFVRMNGMNGNGEMSAFNKECLITAWNRRAQPEEGNHE